MMENVQEDEAQYLFCFEKNNKTVTTNNLEELILMGFGPFHISIGPEVSFLLKNINFINNIIF